MPDKIREQWSLKGEGSNRKPKGQAWVKVGRKKGRSRKKRRKDQNKSSSGQFHLQELAEAPGRGLRGLE